MDIVPFGPDHVDAVEAFLRRIDPGEAAFFKEDISDTRTAAQWSGDHDGAHRFVAIDEDGAVIGYAALIPGVGWSSHVGDLRLFVDQAHRRAGIGRQLARRMLTEALQIGLRKVMVEVVADQDAAVALFTDLGFAPEALLADHIRDRNGHLHDLMLLAHDVADVASAMATLGITDELRH